MIREEMCQNGRQRFIVTEAVLVGIRGGSFYYAEREYPAGSRGGVSATYARDNIAFRSTLFVGL